MDNENDKSHPFILYILVALALGGRLLLGWIDIQWGQPEDQIIDIAAFVHLVLLYLIILISVGQFHAFHIDGLSLTILLLWFPSDIFFRAIFSEAILFQHQYDGLKILICGIAYSLLVFAIIRRIRKPQNRIRLLEPKNMKWLLVGPLLGILLTTSYYVPFLYLNNLTIADANLSNIDLPQLVIASISTFLVHIVTPGIIEETFYRGFIWGFLRSWKLPEITILLITTIIFWAAHFHLFPGSSFWTVPVSGLFLGYLIIRTRSLAVSTLTHAALNMTGLILPQLIRVVF